MNNLKIVKVTNDYIIFDNGYKLTSEHERDCCEDHYLSFEHLTLEECADLEFDFSNDDFLEKIDGYGIALKPIKGHPIRVCGYGNNNGYYSTNLTLVIMDSIGKNVKTYDISECQDIN